MKGIVKLLTIMTLWVGFVFSVLRYRIPMVAPILKRIEGFSPFCIGAPRSPKKKCCEQRMKTISGHSLKATLFYWIHSNDAKNLLLRARKLNSFNNFFSTTLRGMLFLHFFSVWRKLARITKFLRGLLTNFLWFFCFEENVLKYTQYIILLLPWLRAFAKCSEHKCICDFIDFDKTFSHS